MRKTKIICTIGPATATYPMLEKLAAAGMDIIRLNMSHGEHEAAAKVIKSVRTLNRKINSPIAVMLDTQRSSVRTGETNFGNLIAEAIMASVGADVGLTNSGGIRGDRTYDPGTKLTRKDILGELPFGNVTLLIEVSGSDLLEALENGVSSVEDKAGRFP